MNASEIMKIVDRILAELPEPQPSVRSVLQPLPIDDLFSLTLPDWSKEKWRDLSLEHRYDLVQELVRVVPSTPHPVDHAGADSGSR